ncbi:MAG: Uncharacterised protein [Porticoccaceae bacterium UBA1117]|nr:MAG: Uncharacterised protein [Porticoccaceae bacterium UBA1117]
MPIAATTKATAVRLMKGLLKVVRSASAKPAFDTKPKRAAISCNTTVAISENNSAHNSTNPKLAPATLAVAILPGPIKAAVTNKPGPKRRMLFSCP